MDERTLTRFKSKFFVLPTECWLWTGTLSPDGYGMFSLGGQSTTAHRASYLLFAGPIPVGYQIDHLCHTWEPWCPGGPGDHHRRCVNWRHLEPVPPWVNVERSHGHGSETHCPHAHEYTPENTYVDPDGGRECRICRAARSRAWVAAHNPGVRHGTETHCPQGHPYAGENLIITVNGGRACRICKQDWGRKYMRAKRAVERGYIPLSFDSATCPSGHHLTDEDVFAYGGGFVCLFCASPKHAGEKTAKMAEAAIRVDDGLWTGMLF